MTARELALRIIEEIKADMESGDVPRDVKTFSDLHDFVDANCYGGTEELLLDLVLESEKETDDERQRDALDKLCDIANEAQEIVHQWLSGGLEPECVS